MEWYHVITMIGMLLVFLAGVILALKNAAVKPRIRNLLLDADGTLLDFDRSEEAALKDAFREMGYPYTDSVREIYHEKNLACWKALERGEITREELKTRRYRDLFAEIGMEGDAQAIVRIYEKALENYAFPFDGAEQACARLSKKYNLILVTNGTKEVQTSRLLQTSLPEHLKAIYISEDVGYAKPAPEFFDRVFADHPKLKRKETMIVGDSLSGDIAGGNNAGIYTCWVNRTGESRPEGVRIDLEISDITKLEKEL